MARTVQVVYENGVLRPKEPMALREGETVDILVLPRPSDGPEDEAVSEQRDVPVELDPSAVARLRLQPGHDPSVVARRLREIAAMGTDPGDGVDDVAANHDRYLYGWGRS